MRQSFLEPWSVLFLGISTYDFFLFAPGFLTRALMIFCGLQRLLLAVKTDVQFLRWTKVYRAMIKKVSGLLTIFHVRASKILFSVPRQRH